MFGKLHCLFYKYLPYSVANYLFHLRLAYCGHIILFLICSVSVHKNHYLYKGMCCKMLVHNFDACNTLFFPLSLCLLILPKTAH